MSSVLNFKNFRLLLFVCLGITFTHTALADLTVNTNVAISTNQTHNNVTLNDGGTLTIATGATLTVSYVESYVGSTIIVEPGASMVWPATYGNINIRGLMQINGSVTSAGGFYVMSGGVVEIGSTGSMVVANAQSNSNGTIRVAGGGSMTIEGNFANYGTSTLESDGTVNIEGNFTNQTTVSGSGVINVSGTTTNTGTIYGDTAGSPDCTGGCGNVALPVSLISFEAHSGQMGVKLNWITASEKSNDYFTIEKSLNGQDFNIITKVDGAGDANKMLSYSYTDVHATQNAYYRLSQTDFDGTHVYLKVAVVGGASKENTVRLYPNVIDGGQSKLQVEGITADMSWKLIDLNGNYVDCGSFINSQSIEVSNLSKGLYVIQIISSQGFYKTEKLVVR